MPARVLAGLILAAALAGQASADLRGHGGPVGALSVAGGQVLSGSFDTRAILWDADGATALRVLRFHDGNVTAVTFLPDGGLATGGQDGRVAVWAAGGAEPVLTTALHQAPIGGLAASDDGSELAVAGWDGQVQRIALSGAGARAEPRHQGMTMGVAWLADGSLVSIGSDLRLVRQDRDGRLAAVGLPAQPNALAQRDGALFVAFADGSVARLTDDGVIEARAELGNRPLAAISAGDEGVIAAMVSGAAWILDPADLTVLHEFQAGQGPIWSVALAEGVVFTGGGDGLIRRWDAATGRPLGPGAGAEERMADFDDGSRGAEVWRACALCHSLRPDDGNRAGPSLHRIFGRRIASVAGYDYSPALRSMDIIWTRETVAALFEHGPEVYTPGSRMPDQRVPDPADRAALVEFLARVTE